MEKNNYTFKRIKKKAYQPIEEIEGEGDPSIG